MPPFDGWHEKFTEALRAHQNAERGLAEIVSALTTIGMHDTAEVICFHLDRMADAASAMDAAMARRTHDEYESAQSQLYSTLNSLLNRE